jgi:hypothetical protein
MKLYSVRIAMAVNYRLGDIMKYSKNNTGSGVNKRNFSLIGDPSMMLAYPKYSVSTDSINSFTSQ